ncbi:MAG: phosphomannomutase/phosphoglucomutase [Pelotomaculum sp.]|nr:phosphomannomutase/phosphoglucomutase [Pelotomaculum sp.]
MLNPNIFRQYDIRGVAEKDLTPETVELLGCALGIYLRERNIERVAVGADNRLSSPRLKDNLTAGLLNSGVKVLDLGTIITPMAYFAVHQLVAGAAVMVTGSHNPPDENGFKIAVGQGTIYGEEIAKLRRLVEDLLNGALSKNISGKRQYTAVPVDIITSYLDMLQEKIRLGPRRLKVAVDCGNGTASLFAKHILRGWGCEVIPLHCEPDGSFPNHQPDPVKTANLKDLRRVVLEKKCDIGIAYDGDADRIGVVDEKGNIIWGDTLMALYWREILARHPGAPAIIEVKCSQALVDEVRRLGGRPFFYKTGHSLIKAKMKEVGAPFTGEMSGHMFFADEYYGFDDAFYATGRLLRILSNSNRTLSQLLEGVPRYYATAETRIPCPDENKFEVVERLVHYFRDRYDVVDVDGVRVLFGNGWGLVRASNTQPVLVARCEAKTPDGLKKICDEMKKVISSQPHVGNFEWEF